MLLSAIPPKVVSLRIFLERRGANPANPSRTMYLYTECEQTTVSRDWGCLVKTKEKAVAWSREDASPLFLEVSCIAINDHLKAFSERQTAEVAGGILKSGCGTVPLEGLQQHGADERTPWVTGSHLWPHQIIAAMNSHSQWAEIWGTSKNIMKWPVLCSPLPQAVSIGLWDGIPLPGRIVLKVWYPPELPPINAVLHLSLLVPLPTRASAMHEKENFQLLFKS